jgi:uncharacterized protein YcaQ
MPKIESPPPSLILSKTEARRFLLAHHRLWPPRQLQGKAGILEYIDHVGCIQFDPINIVGRNPDLVLQSRVGDYRPELLDELLYVDRQLLDGWDKMASIYRATDWPYFARHRARMQQRHDRPDNPAIEIAPAVLEAILERGPLSSIDLKHQEKKMDWFWGPTRVVRAAMETLYALGELGVHHRVANRRVFDLAERLLPLELLAAPDPNETDEDYREWHVLRRVGSLGLAPTRTSECWYGIIGVKAKERRAILSRLVERGEAVAVDVEGLDKGPFFLRAADLPTLEAVRAEEAPPEQAAFIGALDNLIWDRQFTHQLFDFEYAWEVYKPKKQRKYGYYVLPVLYGDRFVARWEPAFDKETRALTINNWWWETGVEPDEVMQAALHSCLWDFARYLEASEILLGEEVVGNESLGWISIVM